MPVTSGTLSIWNKEGQTFINEKIRQIDGHKLGHLAILNNERRPAPLRLNANIGSRKCPNGMCFARKPHQAHTQYTTVASAAALATFSPFKPQGLNHSTQFDADAIGANRTIACIIARHVQPCQLPAPLPLPVSRSRPTRTRADSYPAATGVLTPSATLLSGLGAMTSPLSGLPR